MVKKLTLIFVCALMLGAVLAFVWGLWSFIWPHLWLLRWYRQHTSNWGHAIILGSTLKTLAELQVPSVRIKYDAFN